MTIDQKRLTRLTVVDENGRAYERWNRHIQLSVQDGGRTLKIFLEPRYVAQDRDRLVQPLPPQGRVQRPVKR